MRLEVRHLRVLAAIARHGSLTRAAVTLGLSQPALTAQLHRIERMLGAPVFERGRAGASPTPFGEFVLGRVRGALASIDDLTAAQPVPGSARLGGIESCMLAGLLTGLDTVAPGIAVRTEYSTRLLFDLVCTGRLDAALLGDYPGHEVGPAPGVEHSTLVVEPVFAAVHSGHRLAAGPSIRLADLAGEAWIVQPPDGTGWPEYFLAECRRNGFEPQARHQITETHLQRRLISAGQAVSLVQPTFAPTPGIAVRPLTGDPLWMRHLLAWRETGPLAGHVPLLTELARAAYETTALSCPAYATWRDDTGTGTTVSSVAGPGPGVAG